MKKMKKIQTKKREVYLPMRNLILRTLAVGGVMSLALVAPKTLTLLQKLDRAAPIEKISIVELHKLYLDLNTPDSCEH